MGHAEPTAAKGKDRSSTELNSYIEALKVRLYQIHKELLVGKPWLPEESSDKVVLERGTASVLQTMRKLLMTGLLWSVRSTSPPPFHVITTVMNRCRRSSRISTGKRTLHSMNWMGSSSTGLRCIWERYANFPRIPWPSILSCFRKFLGLARETDGYNWTHWPENASVCSVRKRRALRSWPWKNWNGLWRRTFPRHVWIPWRIFSCSAVWPACRTLMWRPCARHIFTRTMRGNCGYTRPA